MTLHIKALRGTLYAFVAVAALALVVTLARFLCRRCALCRSCADADTEPMLTTHTDVIEAAEPADAEVDMLDSSKPVFKGLSPGYGLSHRTVRRAHEPCVRVHECIASQCRRPAAIGESRSLMPQGVGHCSH